MLKVLRERTKVILWIVIVGFVGFIFAVWGAGLTSSKKRSSDVTVAEVEGQKIDYENFNRAYRRSLAAARRSSPESADEAQLSRRILEDTWNDFLSGVLLRREVRREKIQVHEEELLEHILNNPPDMLRQHEALQTDGQFDHEKYMAALRTPGQDWRWLENYYANALPLLKLQRRVEASAYVSKLERERQGALEGRKVTVSYLFFDPRQAERLTEEETASVEQHMDSLRERAAAGEDFAGLARAESDLPDAASGGDMGWVKGPELPPSLRDAVQSLEPGEVSDVIRSGDALHLLKVDEVRGEERHVMHIAKQLLLPVSGADIEQYYVEHAADFRQPPLARVTFVASPKVASPVDSAEIKAEVLELAESAARGDDFAELATIYSDAPSASQGGDLGLVTEGTLKPGFTEALAGLEVGDVSDPFLSPEGWQLLKLEEKHEENQETQLRIRHIQVNIEPSEDTLARLLETMEDVAADAQDRGLGTAAAEVGLELRESGTFPRSPVIPGLGRLPRGAYWAHEADVGDISPVLETEDAYYVLAVAEQVPEGTSPLDEVRGRIEALLRAERGKDRAKEQALTARQQLTAGASMREIAADAAITFGEAGPFGAGDYLPEAGGALGEFQGAAFALEKGQHSPVVETHRGFYILELLSSEEGPQEPPSPEQSELLLSAARARLQQEWFAMLVDHAKVKDYRQRFYVL